MFSLWQHIEFWGGVEDPPFIDMMGCLWLYSSPHMYVFIPSECIHVYMMQWNSEKWDCCHCFSDIRCFSSVLFSAKTTFSLFGWYQAHIIFFNFKKTWTGPFSVLLPFIINAKAYMRLLSPKQEAVAERNWNSLTFSSPSSAAPQFFLSLFFSRKYIEGMFEELGFLFPYMQLQSFNPISPPQPFHKPMVNMSSFFFSLQFSCNLRKSEGLYVIGWKISSFSQSGILGNLSPCQRW